MQPDTIIRVRHTVAKRCPGCGEPLICVSGDHASIKGRHTVTKGTGTGAGIQTECPRCKAIVQVDNLATVFNR